jgi:hypothetical protein
MVLIMGIIRVFKLARIYLVVLIASKSDPEPIDAL